MRKPLIATAMLVILVFGVGYLVGQLRGPTLSSAASAGPNGVSGFFHRFAGFQHSGPRAGGQVTGISGNTITVKPSSFPWGGQSSVSSIVVTSSTQYFKDRETRASKSDIKTGSYIAARGSLSSDGKTLTASKVHILSGTPTQHGPFVQTGPHADGTVTAVNGDTITVKPDAARTGSNEYQSVTTVMLTSTTQYIAGRGQSGTKSDIKVNSFIVAEGTLSSDGKTLTATRVVVGGGHGGWASPHGAWFSPHGAWRSAPHGDWRSPADNNTGTSPSV